MSGHKIIKTEVYDNYIIIHLKNSVTLSISSNKNNFHLHFCGTQVPMRVGNNLNAHPTQGIETPNYFDVKYELTSEFSR